MTYYYIKAPPLSPNQQLKLLNRSRNWHNFKRLFPTIMITIGASLIISVIYPILSYEVITARKSKRASIISPVPQKVIAHNKGLLSPVNPNNPQVLASTTQTVKSSVDYNQLQNWFPFSRPQLSPSNQTHYNLSIPKLRIKDAVVAVGGEDLDKALIHYGGTANPGDFGNTVIFGHSVLPTFYNPKSYRAIFSLLPTLETGDEIYIYFDGITYKYIVSDYFEVSPDEIDILEQRYDKKELSLVTCTPPGTYWRRGIIKAQLVSI